MEFLTYFGDVFTPVNFALLLVGTIGGLILGATPGLSPTRDEVLEMWAARENTLKELLAGL